MISLQKINEVQAPALYLCDMSRQIMRDPLISKHGYTFEKTAIMAWLQSLGNDFCPCSGKDMTIHDLVEAKSLREEIHMWRAENGLPSDRIVGMTLCIDGSKEDANKEEDNTETCSSSEQSSDDLLKGCTGSSLPSRGPLRRLRNAFKVAPKAA